MPHAIAPKTDITLNAGAHLRTNRTVAIGNIAALPPLVIELTAIILGNDVLAVRLSQFHESAQLVDDDAALLALQDVRKPAIGQPSAQIAKIKGFLLRTLPFVLR